MDTLNQIDISIIIPIYNVEKYLTVCIDSLKNQGGLRMEIILVNDGSTDLSGEIADEYAKKRGAYQSDSSRERGSIRSPQRWFGYCHGRVHRFFR